MKDKVQKSASSNPIYGLGIIGALIYYISNATGFWMGLLGCLNSVYALELRDGAFRYNKYWCFLNFSIASLWLH